MYFRYVDNWVLAGSGLVYNRGEYVEGFTSPLWVLLLGALRRVGLEQHVSRCYRIDDRCRIIPCAELQHREAGVNQRTSESSRRDNAHMRCIGIDRLRR